MRFFRGLFGRQMRCEKNLSTPYGPGLILLTIVTCFLDLDISIDGAPCSRTATCAPDNGGGRNNDGETDFERALRERYQRLSLLTLDLAQAAGEHAQTVAAHVNKTQSPAHSADLNKAILSVTRLVRAHQTIERLRSGKPLPKRRAPALRDVDRKPSGTVMFIPNIVRPPQPACGDRPVCVAKLVGPVRNCEIEDAARLEDTQFHRLWLSLKVPPYSKDWHYPVPWAERGGARPIPHTSFAPP